jgi:hypothetical protein
VLNHHNPYPSEASFDYQPDPLYVELDINKTSLVTTDSYTTQSDIMTRFVTIKDEFDRLSFSKIISFINVRDQQLNTGIHIFKIGSELNQTSGTFIEHKGFTNQGSKLYLDMESEEIVF